MISLESLSYLKPNLILGFFSLRSLNLLNLLNCIYLLKMYLIYYKLNPSGQYLLGWLLLHTGLNLKFKMF